MKTPFAIGDSCDADEVRTAVAAVFPNVLRRRRGRAVFQTAIVAMGQRRFEHEINRQRGVAFDAHEIGCTWRTL